VKKTLILLLCAALFLCVFAGCGKKTSGDGEFELSGNVEFVCPYSVGGGSDLYARIAADIISKNEWTSYPVMVVNKPGGAGAVGDAYTATKKGDDNTITTYVSAQITGPLMNNTPIKYTDLTPICNLAMDEYTFGVLAKSAYSDLDALIEAAKANPGRITVGGSGKGTEDELVTGLFEKAAGIDLEYISYNSSGEVMTAMLGDHIDAGIFNPNECISQVEVGEVIVLAAFGPERISMFPEVKTFVEQGLEDVVFQQFRGVFGPPEMPEAAVAYWADIFQKVVETDQWINDYLNTNGLTSKFISGAEFDTFLDSEAAKYEEILLEIGAISK